MLNSKFQKSILFLVQYLLLSFVSESYYLLLILSTTSLRSNLTLLAQYFCWIKGSITRVLMILNSCSLVTNDLEVVYTVYRLLIMIQGIQDRIVKLNFNGYTLNYLSLMIEAQEVGFKSSIYMKTLFSRYRV